MTIPFRKSVACRGVGASNASAQARRVISNNLSTVGLLRAAGRGLRDSREWAQSP